MSAKTENNIADRRPVSSVVMQHNHVAMERSEIETVLANWIAQAISGDGQLADDVDPAKWVATNFVNWWHPKVDDSLSDAEGAANRVRDELNRLGGWENKELGEALHELIHVTDGGLALVKYKRSSERSVFGCHWQLACQCELRESMRQRIKHTGGRAARGTRRVLKS